MSKRPVASPGGERHNQRIAHRAGSPHPALVLDDPAQVERDDQVGETGVDDRLEQPDRMPIGDENTLSELPKTSKGRHNTHYRTQESSL